MDLGEGWPGVNQSNGRGRQAESRGWDTQGSSPPVAHCGGAKRSPCTPPLCGNLPQMTLWPVLQRDASSLPGFAGVPTCDSVLLGLAFPRSSPPIPQEFHSYDPLLHTGPVSVK